MTRILALILAVIFLSAHAQANKFEESLDNEIFAMEKCNTVLQKSYDTYRFTQDMTKISQPGQTTALFYVFCSTYEKSARDAVMLVHPNQGYIGRTGVENGAVLINALQSIFDAAADSDMDGALSLPTYRFNGATLEDDKIKTALIMMIYGKNKEDFGKKFICGCGVDEQDVN